MSEERREGIKVKRGVKKEEKKKSGIRMREGSKKEEEKEGGKEKITTKLHKMVQKCLFCNWSALIVLLFSAGNLAMCYI